MCNKDGLDELISKENEDTQDRINQKSEDIIENIRNQENTNEGE